MDVSQPSRGCAVDTPALRPAADHCRTPHLFNSLQPSALSSQSHSKPNAPSSPPRTPSASSHPDDSQHTPHTSHPNSPRLSVEPPTPVQHFVDTLDTPQFQPLTAPHHSPSTLASPPSQSPPPTTCVVCMDQPNDIALAPCQHSHCCLSCFRRTNLYACPICRTAVASVILLSTGMQLPVSLVVPNPARDTRSTARPPPTLAEPVLYERPRPLHARRSLPVARSHVTDDSFSVRSRATSMSSVSVARQAEPSVRSLTRGQEAAFRRLRETGTVRTPSANHRMSDPSHRRQSALSSSSSTTTALAMSASTTPANAAAVQHRQNIVLMGHNRKVMVPLAQKLIAAFPPPHSCGDAHPRTKSTLYVNGEAIRLVLIECPPLAVGPELAVRVLRHSPKLVVLCADFFNVSSFESIVRLDMEVLDYLNVTCIWVLVKSMNMKRPKRTNSVADTDVRAAKHFLSSPRRCFMVGVDGPQEYANMRKLGMYIYRSANKGSSAGRSGSLLEEAPAIPPPRSFSFFCIRVEWPPKITRERPRARRSSALRLARWLW